MPPASPERWRAAEDLFFGALELAPGERLKWLRMQCGNDTGLFSLVEAMVTADAGAAGRLDDAVAAAAALTQHASPSTATQASQVGRRVGQYVVGREIGRGTLGAVYEGSRAGASLGRAVAIKIPARGAVNEEAVRAFEAEREVLARLDHPNIVRLLDAGTIEDGRPYLITSLAEGIPVTRYCREAPVNEAGRLAILLSVCEALQHVHERGVAMRPLKPANIVVSPEGAVKLVDFSGAVWLDRQSAPASLPPVSPALAEYAGPEVRSGAPATVRSDIYSLGAILLEVAAGRKGAQARDAGPFSGVVSRALAEDPARRYGSVREFAAAVRKSSSGGAGRRNGWMRTAVAALALAGIALAVWVGAAPRQTGDAGHTPDSIAVLPFVNLGTGAHEDLIADGLTEDVIAALARSREWKVPSRTAVWQYKGRAIDPREAGRNLGVAAVLEGSVRRAGGQLRVAAQLVAVDDGFHRWAGGFDRTADGGLPMQSEVAALVAAELRSLRSRGRGQGAANPQSRRAVEQADRLFNIEAVRSGPDAARLREIVSMFERAAQLDPRSAAAWAGLSEASEFAATHDPRNRRLYRDKAETAGQRAVEIEPSNARALAALGGVYSAHDWDWRKAEAYWRRAVEASPRHTGWHGGHAHALAALGRYEEAMDLLERSESLAPGDPILSGRLAVFAATKADSVAARLYAGASINRDARYPPSHWALARADELDGKLAQAEARYRKVLAMDSADGRTLGSLGYLLARAGRRSEALEMAARLHAMAAQDRGRETFQALVRAGLGETEPALGLLEQAWRRRDANILGVEMDPRFHELAAEPRFQALLGQLRALR